MYGRRRRGPSFEFTHSDIQMFYLVLSYRGQVD